MPTTVAEPHGGTGVAPIDRRVVITGGSGMIGRWAAAELTNRGWDVVLLGRTAPPGLAIRQMDLLSAGPVTRAIEEIRPTHLLHLAWTTTHGEFWTSADNLDWVGATCTLIRSFIRSGGQRVVCAGTCAEYEWSTDPMVEDRTPLRPATLYGVCKNATREVV
jgi:nucleoside-diphosphate-sugar epimerase